MNNHNNFKEFRDFNKYFFIYLFMEHIVKKLEEQISFIQQEMHQMSDEIFTQQKEISKLTTELIILKNKLHDIENNIGIQNSNEEVPPPHY